MTLLLALGHIHEQAVDQALANLLSIVTATGLRQLGVFAQRAQLLPHFQCHPQIPHVYEILLAPALQQVRGEQLVSACFGVLNF